MCVFESLPAETLNVLAGAPGFVPNGSRLTAAADEKTTCNVELAPGGDIRVEVTTKNGNPVPGATVNASRFSLFGLNAHGLAKLGLLSASDPRFVTDENGSFTLGSLPQGAVYLKISKGMIEQTVETPIAAGKTNVVRVVLE